MARMMVRYSCPFILGMSCTGVLCRHNEPTRDDYTFVTMHGKVRTEQNQTSIWHFSRDFFRSATALPLPRKDLTSYRHCAEID